MLFSIQICVTMYKVKKDIDTSCCVDIVGLPPFMLYVAEILVRNNCNIRIIDKGYVTKRDLKQSTLFTHDHIGSPKAIVAKKELKKINKKPVIKGFHEELDTTTVYLLSSDVVINATLNSDITTLFPSSTLHINTDLTVESKEIQYKEKKSVSVKTYFSAIGNIIDNVYNTL